MALFSSKLRYLLAFYLAFQVIQFGLRWKSYDISPKQFKTVAGKAADAPTISQSISLLTSGMRTYYDPIMPRKIEWQPIQLGGLSLRIYPILTSFTEFAAAFSTPFPITGRPGFHWANTTCTVLKGKVGRFADDTQDETSDTFSSGMAFRHGQFESYVYSFEKDTYIACYGRGFLPFSSTVHVTSGISLGEPLSIVKFYISQVQNYWNNLSHTLHRVFLHYKARATGEL
uniref:Sigma non-opioid intracellular receptor 1 n=1 Tax=Caenorhabditis tropicalis TaxID=1561998 RepID=A0A1I7TG89_9PELO